MVLVAFILAGAWILVLALGFGLMYAARRGDDELEAAYRAAYTLHPAPTPVESVEIALRRTA